MRPKLEIHVDGMPVMWFEQPTLGEGHTLSLAYRDRSIPWPIGDDGQPVNPWNMSRAQFLDAAGLPGPKPPPDRPETWRDRAPLL